MQKTSVHHSISQASNYSDVLVCILRKWTSNPFLKLLMLIEIVCKSTKGWERVFQAKQKPHTQIEKNLKKEYIVPKNIGTYNE